MLQSGKLFREVISQKVERGDIRMSFVSIRIFFLFFLFRAYSNRPVSSSLVRQRGNDILPRRADLAPAGTGKQSPYLRALSAVIREP